ncbi:MAG: AAA family ATPase, partial [Nitrospira sp.]|nr:AAA family ATPase [Nitrospira sp.]
MAKNKVAGLPIVKPEEIIKATGKTIQQHIQLLINARYPIIWVQSYEENRVQDMIAEISVLQNKKPLTWSITSGIRNIDEKGTVAYENTEDPVEALRTLQDKVREPVNIILKDLHRYIEDNRVCRMLRDLHETLKESEKTIIILSPEIRIPTELSKSITVLELHLPKKEELNVVLENTISGLRELAEKSKDKEQEKAKLTLKNVETYLATNGNKDELLRSGLGLTITEFEDVLMQSLVDKHTLDVSVIIGEKEQIIKKSGILEFWSNPASMDDVGGLNVLKEWIRKRKMGFTSKAKEYGIETPKGVFLVGSPGTGKSLLAKVTGKHMNMPLLRLDMGKVYGSHVGQSEENMRHALRIAEAVAPCVTGDTMIVLGDGKMLAAKELYEKCRLGERVIAVDENHKAYSVPLVAVLKKEPLAGLYDIKTTATTIKATGNHRLMTADGWKEVSSIKKDDWLYLPHLKSESKESIRLSDIMPENSVQLDKNTWRMGSGGWTDSILTINSEVLCEEIGEILGYLDSD